MKVPLAPLTIVLLGFLLMSCEQARENAEADELKRQFEQLENDKEEAAAKEKLDSREEALAAKESELEAALNALEKAKNLPPKEAPKPGRAVVVEENSQPDLKIAIRQAELARREASRLGAALEAERAALLRERIAEAEAARLASQCQAGEHGRLEQAFTEAQAEVDVSHRLLSQDALTPRQRGRAELAHEIAEKKFLGAEKSYRTHMQKFHPNEWAQIEAVRLQAEVARLVREEKRRGHQCQPDEHQSLAHAHQVALGAVAGVEQQLAVGNLNARQRAHLQVRLNNAIKDLALVEKPFMGHLLKHHPDDYRQLVADRARAKARELARVRAQANADRVAEEARLRALAEAAARDEAAKLIAAQEAARLAAEALRRAQVCNALEHQQLEASYKAAVLAFGEADKRVHAPNLNPKQESYARIASGAASKKLESAKRALLAHLQAHHPVDHQKMMADLAAAAVRRDLEAKQRAARGAEAQRLRAAAIAKADAAAERARMAAAKLAQEKLVQAELARQEAARVQAAALAEAQAKAEAARLAREAARRPLVCLPTEHKALEEALKVATTARDAAQKRVDDPNINPKQQGYARKALGPAVKNHLAAQEAFDGHLKAHHALEWKIVEAARAAAAKKAALLKK